MNTPSMIDVICPCCQSRLTIDLGVNTVIHHEPAAKATPSMDLQAALGASISRFSYALSMRERRRAS